MPNWVEQNLHVIGPKHEIDRFIRTGFKRRRLHQDTLSFTKLCPLSRSEPKDTYTHEGGVVLIHFRTRTEAHFAMQTSWDYPAAFYQRLPKYWPNLTFVCAVNEEMGQCGGVIAVMQGEVHELVRDFDASYDRRQHRRQVRSVLRRVDALVAKGRPWRLMPYSAWEHRYIPFDAVFDDEFWFYFRTREEMTAFAARYRSRYAGHLVAGVWRRTSLRRARSAS